MILEDWIKKEGLKKTLVAKRLGMWPSNLYNVLSGKQRMPVKHAKNIEDMTKGEVSRDEALFPELYVDKQEDGSEQMIMPLQKARKKSKFEE